MRTIVFLVFILLSVISGQTTIYVGVNGSDSNACTASNLPCATVRGAILKGNNTTVSIANGEYSETFGDAPIVILAANIGYVLSGSGTGVGSGGSTLFIDRVNPSFVITGNAGAFLTLRNLRILSRVNRTSTFIELRAGNKNVTINSVIFSQSGVVSGFDLISVQGGNLTIGNTTFSDILSETVLIFCREPKDNSTVVVQNVTVANYTISNALFYDYGWNNNFAHPRFQNVNFINITGADPNVTGPGGPGPFGPGVQHPGLIDMDLVYCEQKTFEMLLCNFTNLKLDMFYEAPVYFSVEWEQRWAVPVFNFTSVRFTNNTAGGCGGIGINMDMTKDYVRLQLQGCTFSLNSALFVRPGSVSDLLLGGLSHTYAEIDSDTCSSSCIPRIDVVAEYDLLQTCPGIPVPTSCLSYRDNTTVYVNSGTGNDDDACLTEARPCLTIMGAVQKGNNNTIRISSGNHNASFVVVNSINHGYHLIGAASPITPSNWDNVTHFMIQDRPETFILTNYPGLMLTLQNLNFMWHNNRLDVFLISQSQWGWANLTDVSFAQTRDESNVTVVFIQLFKGNVQLLNVRFNNLESRSTMLSNIGFSFNIFNATNVNITNIELTGGEAHIFNDLESEEGGLAFHFRNVLVQNISRERSALSGVDNALFEFSGTSFSEEFTPEVVIFNCTFRHIYIPSDSMILFDVPKEPIFIECTFTNNTARYAGAITAKATGTIVRLYNCSFYANRGSVPQESFSDLNIGSNSLSYEPYDFGFTCSRSCMPRTEMAISWYLMNCASPVDKDGQGLQDESLCRPFFTNLYVSNKTGNDINDCLTLANACSTIPGALFKGESNRINIDSGEYPLYPVFIGGSQGGVALIGNGNHGENRTSLILNFTEHLITLRDYPGINFEMFDLRLYLNVTSNSPRYIIYIGTKEIFQGSVLLINITVTHAENATGCNFISLDAGNVVLVNVLFHNMTIYRPVIFANDHRLFGNNTLFLHNVTVGNVTLAEFPAIPDFPPPPPAPSLFDSGGFYHENYTLLTVENFTSTYRDTNRSISGLFIVSDDVAIFNFTSSIFRNLNLGNAYQAVVVYHNITEDRQFNFANNTFTSCVTGFGAIMVHESASRKLRIFFCEFYNNTHTNPNGVADLFLDINFGLYNHDFPTDIVMSCSRSCRPRINIGQEFLILPGCLNDTDPQGQGQVDPNTCTVANSNHLFVGTGGNDGSSCLSPQEACATVQGAIGKGWNNEILIYKGNYAAPVIVMNMTHRGYSVIGDADYGVNETNLYCNVGTTQFDLTNAPGIYIFLERLRLMVNVSRTEPIFTLEATRDNHNLIEVSNVDFTQDTAFKYTGWSLIRFWGGDVTFVNVSVDGLVGDAPLVQYISHVFRERQPYAFTFIGVNITNNKITGNFPLYDDQDDDYTHLNVMFWNVRMNGLTLTGSAPAVYGLFNFQSNTTNKSVDITNSSFKNLNLGTSYLAPFHFVGTFGQNRAFMNVSFSHNTALRSGGIYDEDEDTKLRIIFGGFYKNKASGSGGVADLDLGPLTDTYGVMDIIATCGNSDGNKISSTVAAVKNLIGYCEEPVEEGENVRTRDVVKSKLSAGAVVAIVVLVLLVVAAATVGIIIFVWYRKKKQQGYEFIGPDKKNKSSVNNSEFEVEGRK